MTAAHVTELPQEPASEAVVAQHRHLLRTLPFQDVEDARRGFVAALEPGVVHADARAVWDDDSYDFLSGDAPETVNPSLWRQSGLNAVRGCSRWCPACTRSAIWTCRT